MKKAHDSEDRQHVAGERTVTNENQKVESYRGVVQSRWGILEFLNRGVCLINLPGLPGKVLTKSCLCESQARRRLGVRETRAHPNERKGAGVPQSFTKAVSEEQLQSNEKGTLCAGEETN